MKTTTETPFKIVLYQPQIPQNTGNIVRTCRTAGADLVLVGPMGFSTDDRWLKRAGLDYWDGVNVEEISDFEGFLEGLNGPFYFLSSKATTAYYDADLSHGACLVFGSETTGLPDWVHEKYPDKLLTIPMEPGARCLNLATSVGITLFEGRRQVVMR
ncbi:MAG: tRNA (cytidine(34)-2'-O)-methyltransferase [Chlamydiia bacterium]|nr:tRNA (cytidine(34)-2'-O)-methyltransferase [Chlamydiia bacterium]